VFADGRAEVFDLDGWYTRFENEREATFFLCEDEYTRYDRLEDWELAEEGLSRDDVIPPTGSEDGDLVPRMLVRRP